MNELDKFIAEAQEKGLVEIHRFKLIGKAQAVFQFLHILTYTKPIETSRNQLYPNIN